MDTVEMASRKLLLLIPTILLTSCATRYVEPTSGEVATIVTLEAPGAPGITFFDNAECDNPQIAFGIGSHPPVKVLAGKPIFLTRQKIVEGMVSFQCNALATLVPEAGATYEIGWRTSYSGMRIACSAPVTRVLDDGKRVPVLGAGPFVPGAGCKHKL